MEKDKKRGYITKKRIVLTGILLAAVAIIAGLSYLARINNYKNAVNNLSFEEVDVSKLADGTYTGECNVDVIYAKVEVIIADGRITDIALLEHRNERGAPAESIIGNMLAEQRVDVDAISGATNSSKVIKKAVENALRGN